MISRTPNIDKLINETLSYHNDRTAKILSERYGLNSDSPKTLAEIGLAYGVTRERIRQIEEVSLNSLNEKISHSPEAELFLGLIEDYLGDVGNLRRTDMIAKDLMVLWNVKSQESVFKNRLNFLAEVLRAPNIKYSDANWHGFWYNDEKINDLARKIVAELLKTKTHDFDAFLSTTTSKYKIPSFSILNYVTISKDFGVGPYGDLGASHWIHVNPKTVRDKSYLILKKSNTPLHFKEIASLINKLGNKKKVHHGTVHNELIKDPRFIWTKRGTYDLKKK